jgi:hypothetical protein
LSLLVAATALALLAFLRLLREPGRKTLIWSIAANIACLFVSDQALLLLPCCSEARARQPRSPGHWRA